MRLELQADCFAGVWAHSAYEQKILERATSRRASRPPRPSATTACSRRRQPHRPGQLDARVVRPAGALVPAGLRPGRARGLRHLLRRHLSAATGSLGSEKAGEDDRADVLVGVLAHAVDRAGARPTAPSGPRWSGYRSIFALKKSTAVVSVRRSSSASSRYCRVSAIVRSASSSSRLFWCPADDVPGLEGLDRVDRLPPRPEAADDHALPEIHVNAVVDHVAGDDQLEVRDVQDAGVVVSVWPTSTITRSCPSSVKRLSGTVTAVTGDGGMSGVHLVPEQRPQWRRWRASARSCPPWRRHGPRTAPPAARRRTSDRRGRG